MSFFFSEPLRLTCTLQTSSSTPCMVSSLLAVHLSLTYSRNMEHFIVFCHPCINQIQKSCHLQGDLFIARIQLKLTVSQSIPFRIWRYNPFRALASLIRRLHSSLFSALLLHTLIPSSCNASLWTTSVHLILGLPTGLWCRSFRLKFFFV